MAVIRIMAGVKSKELTQVQAAELMGLGYRQAKRIWRRYQDEGDAGLIHRLRGQAPAVEQEKEDQGKNDHRRADVPVIQRDGTTRPRHPLPRRRYPHEQPAHERHQEEERIEPVRQPLGDDEAPQPAPGGGE